MTLEGFSDFGAYFSMQFKTASLDVPGVKPLLARLVKHLIDTHQFHDELMYRRYFKN